MSGIYSQKHAKCGEENVAISNGIYYYIPLRYSIHRSILKEFGSIKYNFTLGSCHTNQNIFQARFSNKFCEMLYGKLDH